MTKKQKKIMVWLIVWAGLLIVVLYSPVGSPELYSTQNYYAENQGTSFNRGEIAHASNVNVASDDNSAELEIPEISSTELHTGGNGTGASGTSSQGSSSYGGSSPTFQNNSHSGSGGMGEGGISIIAGGGSRSSDGTSGVSMTNGITSLSSSTLSYNTSNRESVSNPYQSGTGATDPGGDPMGSPIPVGDGWGVFILLGGCYSLFKKRLKHSKALKGM